MWKNKKVIYIIVPFAFLVLWITYSINQPPKWFGQSTDGKWEADFNSEVTSPKGYWSGRIYSEQDHRVEVQTIALSKNGKLIHDLDVNETVTKNQEIEYLSTTKTFSDKQDEYVVQVTWKDSSGTYQDVIHLSPQTRYFVLPKVLFGSHLSC